MKPDLLTKSNISELLAPGDALPVAALQHDGRLPAAAERHEVRALRGVRPPRAVGGAAPGAEGALARAR